MIEKITIIGAGNGGMAAVADLVSRGFDVTLFNRGKERLRRIVQQGGFEVRGVINDFITDFRITHSIQDAVENSDLIFIIVPASAHNDLANCMAPYLNAGQLIILSPGRTLGALNFYDSVKKLNPAVDADILETDTIIYTTRTIDNRISEILALKKKVDIAQFPGNHIRDNISLIHDVFPAFNPKQSTLETGFNNIGSILHPFPTLLNTGRIESPDVCFLHYYEGITRTIGSVLDDLDAERVAIGRKLGIQPITAIRWFEDYYNVQAEDIHSAVIKNESYRTIDAPKTLNHRYIFEDIPTGTVPIVSFAKLLDMESPMGDLIISLSSRMLKYDFFEHGRKIQSYTNAGSTEIKDFFISGY